MDRNQIDIFSISEFFVGFFFNAPSDKNTVGQKRTNFSTARDCATPFFIFGAYKNRTLA